MSLFTSVSLSALPIGAILAAPIHDHQQTKLLGAGIEITEQLLRSLRRRAVDSVVVSQNDLARIHAFRPQGLARTTLPDRPCQPVALANDLSRELDRQAAAMPNGSLVPNKNAFLNRVGRPGAVSYDQAYTNFIAQEHERSIRQMDAMIRNVVDGDSSDLRLAGGIISSRLEQATEDLDAFVCLIANPYGMPYHGRHSTHVAMLAMAIGAKMGLDKQSLVELGFGCWIHDIGMIGVDQKFFEAKHVLGAEEFGEIAKHPLKTLQLIEQNIDCVPHAARMVAYQMHERANGSGYPRGRKLAETHPLARIAAVADTFTALVSPRPHRAGMLPYYAVEKLLKDGQLGLYDPKVVRGLLETVGLFPVGSFVALSEDHYVGRVIRSGGSNFTKPVVEVWKKSNLVASPAVLDLGQVDKLQISKPLASLE